MADQKLRFFLIGDAKQFNRALTSAEQKLKAFGSKMQSTGRSLTMMTAPLVAAGASAIKMGMSFDKSMTKVKTLVGIAGDEVDKMGLRVREMAKETAVGADEAAEALFFITSAGQRGETAMQTLNASLKASALGLGDVATVADAATSAMNAYGEESLNAELATDILTNAVRQGKLSSEELAGSIGSVIPIASNMGVQFHEVGATLAAMSRTGTNAATASMQLKNILLSILKPSKEGADTLAAMGLSSQMLQQKIKDDGLLSTLSLLKLRFEDNNDAQQKVFGGSRALMGIMDLLGKGLGDTINIFDEMTNSAGLTAQEYEKLQNSAEFKLRKAMNGLKESFRDTGITLMNALMPAILKAGEVIKGLITRFNSLSDDTKKFIGIATMIGTVLGPVLIVVGSLISALGSLAGGLTFAATAVKGLTLAMATNPLLLFATALGAVAAKLYSVARAKKAAAMEKFNKELAGKTLDEAIAKYQELSKQLVNNQNELKGFSTIPRKSELKAENKLINEQIGELLTYIETKKAEKAEQDALNQSKQDQIDLEERLKSIAGGDGGTGGTGGPTPEEVAAMSAKALLTTKEKQFAAEIAATKAHYDNLIKLNEGNAAMQEQLEISKNEKLKTINDNYQGDVLTNLQDFFAQKKSVQTQIEDAAAVTDEQRKQLEIQRTAEFYGNLIDQAKKFGLEYQGLVDAMNLKIDEITNGLTEQTTSFASAQQNINEVLKGSFSSLGNQLSSTFGNSGTIFGAFLSNFLQTATSIMAANLATSSADAVKSGTQTALSFGPASAFVLPALVAGAVGVVSKAFSGIKKFAKGGIVSTPTMGLFGEYPGARSNPEVVAPLDKLTGMLGDRGASRVQVGGEFKVKGQDLIVALDRANKFRDRIQ